MNNLLRLRYVSINIADFYRTGVSVVLQACNQVLKCTNAEGLLWTLSYWFLKCCFLFCTPHCRVNRPLLVIAAVVIGTLTCRPSTHPSQITSPSLSRMVPLMHIFVLGIVCDSSVASISVLSRCRLHKCGSSQNVRSPSLSMNLLEHHQKCEKVSLVHDRMTTSLKWPKTCAEARAYLQFLEDSNTWHLVPLSDVEAWSDMCDDFEFGGDSESDDCVNKDSENLQNPLSIPVASWFKIIWVSFDYK